MERRGSSRRHLASPTKRLTSPANCLHQELLNKGSTAQKPVPVRKAATPAKKTQGCAPLRSSSTRMCMHTSAQPMGKKEGFRIREKQSLRLGSASSLKRSTTSKTPLLHQRQTWELLHSIVDKIGGFERDNVAEERAKKLDPRVQHNDGGEAHYLSSSSSDTPKKEALLNLLKPFLSLVEVESVSRTASVSSPQRSSLKNAKSSSALSSQKVMARTVSFRPHTPKRDNRHSSKKRSTSVICYTESSPMATYCSSKARSRTVLKTSTHVRPYEEFPHLSGVASDGSIDLKREYESRRKGNYVKQHLPKTGSTRITKSSQSEGLYIVPPAGVASRLPQGAMVRRKACTDYGTDFRTRAFQSGKKTEKSQAASISGLSVSATLISNRDASDDSDGTINHFAPANEICTGKVDHIFQPHHTLRTTPPLSDSACSAEKLPSPAIRKIRQPGPYVDGDKPSSIRIRKSWALEPHEVEAARRSARSKSSSRSSIVNPIPLTQHDKSMAHIKSGNVEGANVRRSASAHRLESRMPQLAASPREVLSPRNLSRMSNLQATMEESKCPSNADNSDEEVNIFKVNTQLSETQSEKHSKPKIRASKVSARQGRNQPVASGADDARDSSTPSTLQSAPSSTRRQTALRTNKDLAGRFMSLAPPNRQVQHRKASQSGKAPQGKRRSTKVLPKTLKTSSKDETVSPAGEAVETIENECDSQPTSALQPRKVEIPQYLTLTELPLLDEPLRSVIGDVDSLILEADYPRAPEVDEESTELTHILHRCGTLSTSAREAATRSAVSLLARNGPGTLQLVARWMDTAATSVDNDKSTLEDKLSWKEIVPPFFVPSDTHRDMFTQSPHQTSFSLQDLRTFFHEEGFVETGVTKLKRVVRRLTAAKAFGKSQNGRGLWDEATDLSARTRSRWISEYLDLVLSVSVGKLRMYQRPQIFSRFPAKQENRGSKSCGLYCCPQENDAEQSVTSPRRPNRFLHAVDASSPRSHSACRGFQTLFGKYDSNPRASLYETFQTCRRSQSAFPRMPTRQTFGCGASLKTVFCGSNMHEDCCEDDATKELRALIGNMSILPSEAYLYYLRQNCKMERLVKIAVWLVGSSALPTYRQFVAKKLQRVAAMRMLYLVKRRRMAPASQTKQCSAIGCAMATEDQQAFNQQKTQPRCAESSGDQREILSGGISSCNQADMADTMHACISGVSHSIMQRIDDISTRNKEEETAVGYAVDEDALMIKVGSSAHHVKEPDPDISISTDNKVNKTPESTEAAFKGIECLKVHQVGPACSLQEIPGRLKHSKNTRIRSGHLDYPVSRSSTSEMGQTASKQPKKNAPKPKQNEHKEAILRRSQSTIPLRSLHAEASTRCIDGAKSGHKGNLNSHASSTLKSPHARVLNRTASSVQIRREGTSGQISSKSSILSESQLLQEVRKLCQRLRSLSCCQQGCDASTSRVLFSGIHTPPSESRDVMD